jgi:hypothetical protein
MKYNGLAQAVHLPITSWGPRSLPVVFLNPKNPPERRLEKVDIPRERSTLHVLAAQYMECGVSGCGEVVLTRESDGLR